jgi:hypothetical protein
VKDWYHVATTPTGRHVHRLDPDVIDADAARRVADDPELSLEEAEAEAIDDQIQAIRDVLGFPLRQRWMRRKGWASTLAPGEPHPKVLYAQDTTVHADEDDKGRLVNWRLPEIAAAALPRAVQQGAAATAQH